MCALPIYADYWRERAEKAEALVEELADALDGLLAITSDSQGVAGYHLNGAIAEGSDERRVGKELVHPCRPRWSPPHTKKNKQTRSTNYTSTHQNNTEIRHRKTSIN